MESLHPRIGVLWIVHRGLQALVLGAVVLAVDRWVLDVPVAAVVAVVAVVFVLGTAHAVRRYQVWQFEVQPDALYIERGVITFFETSIPSIRVQHVDTRFGPVERLVGLSSVVVYTAGSRNADVRIPGLTPDRARELRETLRELAVESDVDDTH